MKIPSLKLQSHTLLIRTYTLSDAKSLFELVDSNKKTLSDYFPMTVENNTSVMAKRQYILERNSERNSGKSLFAGIFTSDKKLIGQICAKDMNWRVPKCELGYFIDKNFTGKGFGSEAVQLFSDFCFEKLKIAKISLRIEPSNIASKKLAEKCGFELIGIAKNDFRSSTGRLMECEIWEKIDSKIQ